MNFYEVSGDASQPTDDPKNPKNNQKGPGLDPGILVTVQEDVVGLHGQHSPQNLEGSGDVEVTGVIYDDVPGTTSRKSPMF